MDKQPNTPILSKKLEIAGCGANAYRRFRTLWARFNRLENRIAYVDVNSTVKALRNAPGKTIQIKYQIPIPPNPYK